MATANSPYLWHKGTNLSSFCMKETVPHRPWYQPSTQPCHLAFAVVEKSPRSTWHYNPFGAINNASITSKALIVLIEVINLNILDSFPSMMNKFVRYISESMTCARTICLVRRVMRFRTFVANVLFIKQRKCRWLRRMINYMSDLMQTMT